MEIKNLGHDPFPSRRTAILAAGGLIVLAALAVYRNSLSGPFIFDDVPSIRDNATIRHLWPLGPILSPHQGGMTTSGRPLVNLSFAVNHAISGIRVWGYHATNLAIHILAGLTLFGIARRTLLRWSGLSQSRLFDGAKQRVGDNALHLAFAIALIWTVHPLATEAVTYTVQRAESLMGLFYLLTLYFFIRFAEDWEVGRIVPNTPAGLRKTEVSGSTPPNRAYWGQSAPPRNLFLVLSIFFCLLGMASKEVMVSAPVIVLLYDRTFLSGSFRDAWRRRRWYYIGLAATWIPLAYFVLSTKNRGGTAGLDLASNITATRYWLTQFPAIVLYLKLAVWPRPLALDYGAQVVNGARDVIAYAVVVLGLVVGTAYLLFRPSLRLRSGQVPRLAEGLGFCGAFFFAVLAPTSLIPIVSQTVAEHRMYLALAPVVAVGVIAIHALLARILDRSGTGRAARWCFGFCVAAAAGYGLLTEHRNHDYRSEVGIWGATVATYPLNARTQYNLGIAYHDAGDDDAAIEHYKKSLRLDPTSSDTHNNWGVALVDKNRWTEAMEQFNEALRLKPDDMNAVYNLGNACMQAGDFAGAIARFERAIQLSPEYTDAYYKLGLALVRAGRPREAVAPFRRALRLKPDYVEVHVSLGIALGSLGNLPDAILEFKEATRLKPDFYPAHLNLGHAYQLAGRIDEARAEFEEAFRLNGNRPPPDQP